MKTSLLLFTVLLSLPVFADGEEAPSGGTPDADWSLANSTDYDDCMAAADKTCRSQDQLLAPLPKAEAKKAKAIGGDIEKKSAELSKREKRLRKLEDEVKQLQADADVGEEVVKLREEVNDIQESIASLKEQYRLVVKDYVTVAGLHNTLDDRFGDTERKIDDMRRRFLSLESRLSPVKAGAVVGFTAIRSADGTVYSGAPVLARLTLNLTDKTFVSVSGGALLSNGKSPVGSLARGGIGHQVNECVGLETGFSALWVGYDRQLNAQAMFLMADVGVAYRYSWFSVVASGMGGVEFDRDRPSPAFGGSIAVRGTWPK